MPFYAELRVIILIQYWVNSIFNHTRDRPSTFNRIFACNILSEVEGKNAITASLTYFNTYPLWVCIIEVAS